SRDLPRAPRRRRFPGERPSAPLGDASDVAFEGSIATADTVDAAAESIKDPHAVAALRTGGRRPEPIVLIGKHLEKLVAALALQSDVLPLVLRRQAPLQPLGPAAGFHHRVARSLRVTMVHLAIQRISPQQARVACPNLLAGYLRCRVDRKRLTSGRAQ